MRNTSESGDGLVWLTGYLPVDEAERFKAAAAKEHWAWAMDDPAADDDKVPTKIKYTKVTRLIAPVFDILGTVPGYREFGIDISVILCGPETVAQPMLCAAIKEAIERFEPRATYMGTTFKSSQDNPGTLLPVVEVSINA